MKTLVIFDLDGVLVDACEWHRIALNKALYEVSGYEIPIEEHHSEFNGRPTRVKLSKLVDRGIIEEKDIDAVYALKQKFTIETIEESAHRRQEKVDLMLWLKEKDFLIACFTNSIRETAELMLKKTGVFEMLDMIVTNEDVKNPKPDPEGYLKIMKKLRVYPDNVIIVEDSPTGLKAAVDSTAGTVVEVSGPKVVNIDLLKDGLARMAAGTMISSRNLPGYEK